MTKVLITGMSGVGKTAAVEELRRRGYPCIDMDEDGWSHMDGDGHQHWNTARLDKAMAEWADGILLVSGCAEEQVAFRDRFQAVVLLSAPRQLMEERIRCRAGNPFGKAGEEMRRIIADLEEVEPLLRQGCTEEICTTVPVGAVADRILAVAQEATMRSRGRKGI